MSEIKIGDGVRIINKEHFNFDYNIGDTGVVTGINTDNENMLICPKCGTKFPIGEWNKKTLDSFGSSIEPITLEDFEDSKIPRGRNSFECDYVCPYCGEEIAGEDLILDK